MRVLILGFGPLAREIAARVKHFPEYGFHKEISIYHIFTGRNSLSYGKNLVVEIPDPQNDGYRTYRDGFQALEFYNTTVSNYVPWLLDEAKNSSFHVVINCMDDSESATKLEEELKANLLPDCIWIAANENGAVDAVITQLRHRLDGGKDWKPIEYSPEFMAEAHELWVQADKKMAELHIMKRTEDVYMYGHPDKSTAKTSYARIGAIPSFDFNILERFVINNEEHPDLKDYNRVEQYNDKHRCTIVEHDLLTSFFGWHHAESVACRAFGNPYLQIESAKYVRYEEDDSTHIDEESDGYVIEFVYKGKLKVLPTSAPLFVEYGQPYVHLEFEAEDAYSYVPSVNPPKEKLVEKGLETVIFTFKEGPRDN